MKDVFVFNERLGLALPELTLDWESYNWQEKASILEEWETIRGRIPDLVVSFEQQINAKQAELYDEENFERSCSLNTDIADLASRINDLLIWYRIDQEVETRRHS